MPVFMMMNSLGLYDTYSGIIITILATSMAFPILLMRSFFDGVPVALEEAAFIDGCSRFQTLLRIVIPVALPASPRPLPFRSSAAGASTSILWSSPAIRPKRPSPWASRA